MRCRSSPSARDDGVADLNAYEVLGLGTGATAQEIREAYRELQKVYHPDVYRGEDGPRISARINLAYEILTSAEDKRELDGKLKARGKTMDGFGGNIVNRPGIVGPIRGKLLESLQVCGEVDECAVVDPEVLTDQIREWGRMLAFTSEMPLPLPLQCDDVPSGLKLALVKYSDGAIREVGALTICVIVQSSPSNPGSGESYSSAADGQPLELDGTSPAPAAAEAAAEEEVGGVDNAMVEVQVMRKWAEGTQAGSDTELPGEGRIIANFKEEFTFLMSETDAESGGDGKTKKTGALFLAGVPAAVASFALPALPFFGSTRNVTPGGAYNAYRIRNRKE